MLDQIKNDEVTVQSHVRKKKAVREPLPAYLPREIVIHDLLESEKICSCGEHLVRIGEEISEQLNTFQLK